MPFGKENGMILPFRSTDPGRPVSLPTTPANRTDWLLTRMEISSPVMVLMRQPIRPALEPQDARVKFLADRYQGKRFNSPNDLCVDVKGRVYFTDPRYGGAERASCQNEAVYRLAKDRR